EVAMARALADRDREHGEAHAGQAPQRPARRAGHGDRVAAEVAGETEGADMTDGTPGDDNVGDMGGRGTTQSPPPPPQCIELIKMLLERAESGDLRQIAVVWVDGTGRPTDAYAPGAEASELIPIIGGLELCKATLLSQMVGA